MVDTALNVVEVSSSTISTVLSPRSRISDFGKTNYRGNVFRDDHSAQAARLTAPDHVRILHSKVREDRWVRIFGAISWAEKSQPSDCLSFAPSC